MKLTKGCSPVCFQLSSNVSHVVSNIQFQAIISKVSFQGACVGEYSRINVAMSSTHSLNNASDYNTDDEVLLGKSEENVGESTREGKDVSFLNLFWFGVLCYLFIIQSY